MTSDKKAGEWCEGEKIHRKYIKQWQKQQKRRSSIQTKAAPKPFLIPLSAFHAPCPKPIP